MYIKWGCSLVPVFNCLKVKVHVTRYQKKKLNINSLIYNHPPAYVCRSSLGPSFHGEFDESVASILHVVNFQERPWAEWSPLCWGTRSEVSDVLRGKATWNS